MVDMVINNVKISVNNLFIWIKNVFIMIYNRISKYNDIVKYFNENRNELRYR